MSSSKYGALSDSRCVTDPAAIRVLTEPTMRSSRASGGSTQKCDASTAARMSASTSATYGTVLQQTQAQPRHLQGARDAELGKALWERTETLLGLTVPSGSRRRGGPGPDRRPRASLTGEADSEKRTVCYGAAGSEARAMAGQRSSSPGAQLHGPGHGASRPTRASGDPGCAPPLPTPH